MLERITNLKRLKPLVWSAAFVVALSLTAIATLSACGDETKPAATPNSASTLIPESANTSTPGYWPDADIHAHDCPDCFNRVG